jgi:hypothetical protein
MSDPATDDRRSMPRVLGRSVFHSGGNQREGSVKKPKIRMWGCWATVPKRHSWEPQIHDMACGFDERMTHPRCAGCHRQRTESPLDQLAELYPDASEDGRT